MNNELKLYTSKEFYKCKELSEYRYNFSYTYYYSTLNHNFQYIKYYEYISLTEINKKYSI